MKAITISSKYRIVIPRELRKKLGVKAGDKLLVVVEGQSLVVSTKPKSV